MTAEERLAYFQGERKRVPAYQEQKNKNYHKILFKIKFFLAVVLFVLFLSMDYTGYKIKGIGSEQIINEITKDFTFLHNLNL